MSLDFSEIGKLTGGLDAIRLKLKQQGEHKAVRAGARVIQEAMVERTPVQAGTNVGSDSLEPGAMKDDIRVQMIDDEGEPAALIGPGKKTAHVANWVEYGHRMVTGGQSKLLGKGKSRGSGKASMVDVPAHPFLRPAFEASEQEALAAVEASLSKDLEEVARA